MLKINVRSNNVIFQNINSIYFLNDVTLTKMTPVVSNLIQVSLSLSNMTGCSLYFVTL